MSFGVRELTAEIIEARIIVQGCWQGSKLRVAYGFAGVGHFREHCFMLIYIHYSEYSGYET